MNPYETCCCTVCMTLGCNCHTATLLLHGFVTHCQWAIHLNLYELPSQKESTQLSGQYQTIGLRHGEWGRPKCAWATCPYSLNGTPSRIADLLIPIPTTMGYYDTTISPNRHDATSPFLSLPSFPSVPFLNAGPGVSPPPALGKFCNLMR